MDIKKVIDSASKPPPPFPFPVSPGTVPAPSDDMPAERLNATQRREFSLSENVEKEADLWAVADALEARAKTIFPTGWVTEIRITYDDGKCPARWYHVRAVSHIGLTASTFKMNVLSPATSRSDLGCWVVRAFTNT